MRRNHLPTVTMPSLRTNRRTDPANSGLFVLFQEISGAYMLLSQQFLWCNVSKARHESTGGLYLSRENQQDFRLRTMLADGKPLTERRGS